MTQRAAHLYRQNLTLDSGQGTGHFIFDPGFESNYVIKQTFCHFEYKQQEGSRFLPLSPIEIIMQDSHGQELIYTRLGAYREDGPTHHYRECQGKIEIVVVNPNISNRCQLVVTLFVEIETEEPFDKTWEPINKVKMPDKDTWQEYVKRQQQRRKKAFGVSTPKISKTSWLQLLLLSWCLTFSYIPVSHFELLLCLLVL